MAKRQMKPGKTDSTRRARAASVAPKSERIWRETRADYDDESTLQRRTEWLRDHLGVTNLRRLTGEIAQFRARKPLMQSFARASADAPVPMPKTGARAMAMAAGAAGVRASVVNAGPKNATWGETGRYVKVTSASAFASTSVRIALEDKLINHLFAESIVVARWDEEAERFRIVPQSGFNAVEGYAYARVTQSGTYTALGLPRDPRILTTLHVMAAIRPWMLEGRKEPKLLIDRICQLILCADFMQEMLQDDKALDKLGLSSRDLMGGFGAGNICDQCLGISQWQLPELDILDLSGLKPGVIKPHWPNIPIWPSPCSTWTNLGPRNVTGRIGVLAIHPTNGNVVFAGTTAGGVWRTTNGGSTWTPLMSNELSLAIGGLGIAASNPDVLYAATGEWTSSIGTPVDPITVGVGVYRTRNSGGDWDLCTPIASATCAAVAIDPTNPDRVFVAGERALHRSLNGGLSWDIPPGKTFGIFDGEISDVVIDPTNINRIYMGVHRDGVYRSLDGGATWARLQNGIDTGSVADAPRIALGRNGAHSTSFVAVKMGDRVYTSINTGTLFTRRTDVGNPIWFTAWANAIAVDPQNESILFAGASNLYRSTNGGSSWTQVGGYGTNVHADMQNVAFDPGNHNHVYVANDGGIWASNNNGVAWSFASAGLVATHFYVMGVSETATLRYGGSVQDDDGYAFNGAPDWVSLNAGEGGYVEYDPTNAQVFYQDTWFGSLMKTTNGGVNWTSLGINTDTHYAEPLAIARGNSNLLLAIKQPNLIARSTNGGAAWTDVLNPGVALSAVRFAPSDDQHTYAGSVDGRVWHSTNAGQTWFELNTAAIPNAKIHSIAVDWTNPLRIYVAFAGSGIRHLFRGDVDAAINVVWFDVSGVLPAVSLPDLPLTGLALHPVFEETIYVATLLGVLRSVDGGDSWEPFDEGLPNAFVSDIDLRATDRSLFASTIGRGIYRRFV